MRPRLLTALAAGALTLTLLPTGPATADPRELPGPSLPDQASATAEERADAALDQAQALLQERPPSTSLEMLDDGGAEATMVLNRLLRVREDLGPSERSQADALLARPTRPGGDGIADYRVREAKPYCGGALCVHYVRRTADAPPRADADRDRVPNVVEQTLQIARHVHATYLDAGYRRPDPDGRRGGRRNKVDIYLADLGDQGFYGYCTSDQPRKFNNTTNYWAYCAVDDDFAKKQFRSNTPRENRKVTLAHEYFHAVQFAYDFFEDDWFMEATATWAEDELYDGIDDNRQYLSDSQLGAPWIPLDRFSASGNDLNHYGNWIYFRYLTEHWPAEAGTLPKLVRDTWRKASGRAGAPDMFSTEAVKATLTDLGEQFTPVYGDFTVANRDPAENYSEGAAYEGRVVEPLRVHTMSSTTPSAANEVDDVDHLSSDTVAFKPGADLTDPGWELAVETNLPDEASAPIARLIVHWSDGSATPQELTQTDPATNTWTATVPFNAADVTDVELVIANASLSKSQDGKRTSYTATLSQTP